MMTIFTMSSQLPSNMPHSKINIKRFCSAGFSASLQSAESLLVSTHLRKSSRVTKSQHNSPTYYFSVQNNSTVPKCVSKLQSDGWVVVRAMQHMCVVLLILISIEYFSSNTCHNLKSLYLKMLNKTSCTCPLATIHNTIS